MASICLGLNELTGMTQYPDLTAALTWVGAAPTTSFSTSKIEAETKWPPFRRRHFQTHFLEWKFMNFY